VQIEKPAGPGQGKRACEIHGETGRRYGDDVIYAEVKWRRSGTAKKSQPQPCSQILQPLPPPAPSRR